MRCTKIGSNSRKIEPKVILKFYRICFGKFWWRKPWNYSIFMRQLIGISFTQWQKSHSAIYSIKFVLENKTIPARWPSGSVFSGRSFDLVFLSCWLYLRKSWLLTISACLGFFLNFGQKRISISWYVLVLAKKSQMIPIYHDML